MEQADNRKLLERGKLAMSAKKKFLQPRPAPGTAGAHSARRDEDSRYAQQRAYGFPWLRFNADLEAEYRTYSGSERATGIRRAFAAVLLAFSASLTLLEFDGGVGPALIIAVLLGWLGLYLAAHESRHSFLVQAELRQQAQIDGLTGAMNRRAFRDHLDVIWRQAEREGVAVGLLLLDLDHFKELNDQHGHQAGDEVLCSTTEILKSYAVRPLDAVGRYGGDEFIVAWYGADPGSFDALIQLLPAKLWMGLARTRLREANITVSGGAVLVRPSMQNPIMRAIHAADEELYRVKRSCRGSISLAPTFADVPEQHATQSLQL